MPPQLGDREHYAPAVRCALGGRSVAFLSTALLQRAQQLSLMKEEKKDQVRGDKGDENDGKKDKAPAGPKHVPYLLFHI